MWTLLSREEQLYFIRSFSGVNAEELTLDIIHICETRLSEQQRQRYVHYSSGEIAAITYRVVDPSSAAAADYYYFNLLNMSVETKAKMLWHAVNGVQP